MAGGFVNIDITADAAEAESALRLLAARGKNLKPVFADIGEHLINAADQRFEDQESPEGDPWVELSPAYYARKKRNTDKILVLHDILGATLRYQATAKSLLFGTDRIYGATHQFGREEAGIPARPFLGLSDGDLTEIREIVLGHLAP